jgi:hypothetical protein
VLSLQERMVGQLREKQLELTAMQRRVEAQAVKRIEAFISRRQRCLLHQLLLAWHDEAASPVQPVHAVADKQLKGLRLRQVLHAWQGVTAVRKRLLQQRRAVEHRLVMLRKRTCFQALLVRPQMPASALSLLVRTTTLTASHVSVS